MNRPSPIRAATLSLALLAAGCGTFSSSQDAGSARPSLTVAEAALRSGSGQAALQVSETILRTSPDDVAALVVKADALTLMGVPDQAAEIYQALLAKDPNSTRATIGLGRVKLSKDPAAAEVLFQRVVTRDPKDLTALNNLGIARDLQGRHKDAQTVYRQALAIDPAMTAAQVNLALSLAISGQGAEAVRLLKPAASAPDATAKVKHDYAVVLAMAGQRAEAEKILAQDLPPDEVRKVLEGIGGTKSPRGAAPDRNEQNRAATQANRARGDAIPPDVVEPIPAPTALRPAASTPAAAQGPARAPAAVAPSPEIVRPGPASARDGGAALALPADPADDPGAPRVLSRSIVGVEPPPAAGALVLGGSIAASPQAGAPVEVPVVGAPPVSISVQPPVSAPVRTAMAAAVPMARARDEGRADAAAPPVSAPMATGPAVQFTAAPSEEAARSYWRELVQRFPAALGQREPVVSRVRSKKSVLWLLRTEGFSSKDDARSLCAQMRAAGKACFAVKS